MSEDEALPFVSVILAIRNEAETIEGNLAALLEQDYPADRYEVIVVDGDSDDGTAETVEAFFASHPDRHLRLLHNPERVVPISLNIAVRAARADIIARMDGHARMADDYIRRCVEVMAEQDADVVGGPIETVGTSPFGCALAFAQSSPAGIGNSQFRFEQRGMEVPTVAFGTFRRSAFEEVGLFDESLVRTQDYEMNVRIRKAGRRIWHDPRITSRYFARSRPSRLWRQYFGMGWWRVETLRRHPDSARPNHVVPLLLVAGLLVPIPALRVRLIKWAWTALAATYGTFVTVGALAQLRRGAKPVDIPRIITAIVIMQVGYGMGTLVHLVTGGRWPHDRGEPTVPDLPPRPT